MVFCIAVIFSLSFAICNEEFTELLSNALILIILSINDLSVLDYCEKLETISDQELTCEVNTGSSDFYTELK